MADKWVEKRYAESGLSFGDAASYLFMGECYGFEKLFVRWERWEVEYAKRGYRTVSLDAFVASGGYGAPFQELGMKRSESEEPTLYASIFRAHYFKKT